MLTLVKARKSGHLQEFIAQEEARGVDAAEQAVDALAGRRLTHVDLAIFQKLYHRRIRQFRNQPPPPGWDGVHSVEGK